MKKIFNYIILATALVAAFSCNKPAPEKSQVEAGFKALGDIPTVAIIGDVTVNLTEATVKFSVEGVTASTLDSLSIGVLVSKADPYYGSASFTKLEGPYEDGTYELTVPVSPKAKNYFRVSAANLSGTHYSNDVAVDVPDVPFHLKLDGEWYSEEASVPYGDEYERYITIVVDEQDPTKCVIGDIEPYFLDYGYAYPTYNYAEGIIDDDAMTITITSGSLLHLGSYMISGLNDAVTALTDLVFQMDEDDNLVRAGLMATLTGSGNLYDYYAGGVTYTKK